MLAKAGSSAQVELGMAALSERKLDVVRTLVESAPDKVVDGLNQALSDASGDTALASVRRLVEAEARDRQLRNIVERLLILAGDDLTEAVTADLLPTDLGSGSGWSGSKGGDLVISLPLREAREIFERDYLVAQINRFGGNISRTAAFIGMERSALHRKLKSLGVGSAQNFNA